MFSKGVNYTRDEIHDKLGGNIQSYLPTVNGQVVAACFKRSEDMNPEAPDVILVGSGPIIESTAKILTEQGYAVPTFIKLFENQWEYVGTYKVYRQSFNKNEIEKHLRKAKRKDKVTSVLFLIEEK